MIYGDLYKEINILKSYVETLPEITQPFFCKFESEIPIVL